MNARKLVSDLVPESPVQKIYHDVEGAPFSIGDCVKIAFISDDTADAEHFGKIGTVDYFEYSCGCGQTFPADPMIGVKFGPLEFAEFWKEELELV